MTPTHESRARGTRSRFTTAFRIAAVLGGATVALAGCTANSPNDTPAANGTASATASAVVSTTVRGDDATTAPPRAETPEPTRADTQAPGTPAGTPSATTVNSPSGGSWDPCTLSESALSAAGLDLSTEARVSPSTYPSCKWQSTDRTFELIIVASGDSMDTVLEPGTYTDLRRSEYYGRQFALFRSVADSHKVGCHIATPSATGSIVFTVRNTRVATDYGEPCNDAQRVGAGLFNSLP
ncbi:DUF3558 domain-containing protein [Nocardia sp. 2]|uniref:DUF3558 domain-containing protein n=1 Tax=Nocardia acididurans TaxID=2802282 RepID=A0ABS1M623_9NOCA|nr:DUF3558 family protein [Nocardia acididurans]MBL1076001.1 DUF3558 domain-containing protein [Nocardia acididurans]